MRVYFILGVSVQIHAPTPLARASTSTCQSSGESGLDKEVRRSFWGGVAAVKGFRRVPPTLATFQYNNFKTSCVCG